MSRYKPRELLKMESAINKLLERGAVVKCKPTPGPFISPYFLIPKKDGSSRFVINLKSLNKFITTQHFKLEDLRTAAKLVSKESFMTSIDLKDSYFLIIVYKTSRKYLRFYFNNQLFEFTCLTFGLSLCPYIFTKIMKLVIGTLRAKDLLARLYLDDFLCIGKDEDESAYYTQLIQSLLGKLGFI